MAASSKDTNTYNRQNWENSDFPILCETCLGDNPYIRMTKEKYGKECKVCERPFTVFRWCPGAGMRFKKTEVCQTCSKIKNVCQTCLLDLEYGLPTQLRDAVLGQAEVTPTSAVNKDYWIQNKERELANTDGTTALGVLGKSASAHQTLLKLARHQPYYKRNRAHICSFWVKGECTRGDLCPYRHEMPTDPNDPLAKQNMKDRYYGTNDPVAEKYMKRHESREQNQTPTDPTITTLFIGGVTPESGITEQDLRDYMYQFGEIRRVSMVAKQGSAFVEYADRGSAERAMAAAAQSLAMKGQSLKVMWGRGRSKAAVSERTNFAPVPGLPGAVPLPPGMAAQGGEAAPPGMPATPGAPPASLPPGMLPPGMLPPGMLPPGMGMAGSPSVLLPPGIRPPAGAAAFFMPAGGAVGAGGAKGGKMGLHYPSMDASRMGARSQVPARDGSGK